MVDVVQPSRFFGPKLRGNDVRLKLKLPSHSYVYIISLLKIY